MIKCVSRCWYESSSTTIRCSLPFSTMYVCSGCYFGRVYFLQHSCAFHVFICCIICLYLKPEPVIQHGKERYESLHRQNTAVGWKKTPFFARCAIQYVVCPFPGVYGFVDFGQLKRETSAVCGRWAKSASVRCDYYMSLIIAIEEYRVRK